MTGEQRYWWMVERAFAQAFRGVVREAEAIAGRRTAQCPDASGPGRLFGQRCLAHAILFRPGDPGGRHYRVLGGALIEIRPGRPPCWGQETERVSIDYREHAPRTRRRQVAAVLEGEHTAIVQCEPHRWIEIWHQAPDGQWFRCGRCALVTVQKLVARPRHRDQDQTRTGRPWAAIAGTGYGIEP